MPEMRAAACGAYVGVVAVAGRRVDDPEFRRWTTKRSRCPRFSGKSRSSAALEVIVQESAGAAGNLGHSRGTGPDGTTPDSASRSETHAMRKW